MNAIEPKTGRIVILEIPDDPTQALMGDGNWATPTGSVSNPPSGGKKVTNLYVNSDGKLVVEYDTTPVP
jgi:hypothetical protein